MKINFDSYYDPPDDSKFENLCVLIGTHWFPQDEAFIDHDNDVIDYMASIILNDHHLYANVIDHLEKLEAKWIQNKLRNVI